MEVRQLRSRTAAADLQRGGERRGLRPDHRAHAALLGSRELCPRAGRRSAREGHPQLQPDQGGEGRPLGPPRSVRAVPAGDQGVFGAITVVLTRLQFFACRFLRKRREAEKWGKKSAPTSRGRLQLIKNQLNR